MSNKKFTNGKGYYIALALCALAIGVSGYLYYSHANQEQTQLSSPDVTTPLTVPNEESDLPVVATQPQQNPSQPTETTVPTVIRKPLQTVSPVEGEIVVVYAMDSLGYNPTTRDWRTHNGVDIAAEEGSVVCAAAEGTVYTVYEDDTMGMTVVIRHQDGYITKYASLAQEVSVKAGDTVTMGQKIGYVGSTALLESAIGDHVHFSVTRNDEPVDPSEFLNN
jgi:murein DD-endopeptidase MepM/ murein hydrolase activator NlpD